MTTARLHARAVVGLGLVAAVLTPGLAAATGPHSPAPSTGCTAVSTGGTARCSFVASRLAWGQQAFVLGDPTWTVWVSRRGRTHQLSIDRSHTCFAHDASRGLTYMCPLPLQPGDRVTLVVRSRGSVRAGDDVCAQDPLCMSGTAATTSDAVTASPG